VPAYAITAGGLLLPLAAPLLGAGIVVSGALYFADRRMKTADNHFRGFPALWNAAAFYLFLLHWPPWLSSLVVAVLIALTFVPFNVVHPVRVVRLRTLTLSLIGIGRCWRSAITRSNVANPSPLASAPSLSIVGSDAAIRCKFRRATELLISLEAWAALPNPDGVEIVLGIDNVIFCR
jgi:phosphatidylcholine synthase